MDEPLRGRVRLQFSQLLNKLFSFIHRKLLPFKSRLGLIFAGQFSSYNVFNVGMPNRWKAFECIHLKNSLVNLTGPNAERETYS